MAVGVAVLAALSSSGVSAATTPAAFTAGAAIESIDPNVPVYSGGFGRSPAITATYAHLSSRALYVSNGAHAALFATVDSQAYFASYQEGPDSGRGPRYGITDVRRQAAAQISALGGPAVSQADIIVQGTHSHSAATLEGIWGPVPLEYLKLVHDQTIKALVDAARAAQPARLQWAAVSAPELDNIVTAQTDAYPGWSQDGQLSVLRAVSPGSGATIAVYANIPAHPDIVDGAGLKMLGADYFGSVREALQRQLGGIAVVAGATLGREESPVQVGELANMEWYAGVVTNLVDQGLARAQWVSDSTMRSSETLVRIPGANAALLALVAAWKLPDAQKQEMLDATGLYPIDRDMLPPYLTGNVIGTYVTAERIGGLVYLSMPGEPFPEVRYAILGGTRADMIVSLSKGQDDLGYFYPAWAYGFTYVYPSDHNIYNVAPQAGDQVIQAQLQNIAAVGIRAGNGIPRPMPTDFGAIVRPGLQALASPPTGDAGPTGTFSPTFQAIYEPASLGNTNLPAGSLPDPLTTTDAATLVHWSFGDGTTADTTFKSFGSPSPPGDPFFTHAFRPGSYKVNLEARSRNGRYANWVLPITVHPCLAVAVADSALGGAAHSYAAAPGGGDGHVLATRWMFSDGTTAAGSPVIHSFAPGVSPGATVTITDGTGTMTSASVDASGSQVGPPPCATAPSQASAVGLSPVALPDTSRATGSPQLFLALLGAALAVVPRMVRRGVAFSEQ